MAAKWLRAAPEKYPRAACVEAGWGWSWGGCGDGAEADVGQGVNGVYVTKEISFCWRAKRRAPVSRPQAAGAASPPLTTAPRATAPGHGIGYAPDGLQG